MNFRLSLLSLITAVIIFGFISNVHAASSSSILVDVTPENPAPYEDVSISLNSYANNLDSVLISWSVNGKSALSGIGKKSFSLTAPGAGVTTNVIATIALPDGTVDTRITIKPAVMVLLWQANDSFVPPFYKGKAMPTQDSEVKVVAMPEIRSGAGLVSPKNMTYAWKKDYTNDQGGSGYGKNFFLYTNDYLDSSNNIEVTATTINGQTSSDASLDIGATQPKIVFYKSDKDLGTIWEKALGDPESIQGDEIVVAEPYFISPKDVRNPRLTFNWFINDSLVPILGFRKNVIPLRAQAGTTGTSKLRLEIENKDKIFQTASKEISIQF